MPHKIEDVEFQPLANTIHSDSGQANDIKMKSRKSSESLARSIYSILLDYVRYILCDDSCLISEHYILSPLRYRSIPTWAPCELQIIDEDSCCNDNGDGDDVNSNHRQEIIRSLSLLSASSSSSYSQRRLSFICCVYTHTITIITIAFVIANATTTAAAAAVIVVGWLADRLIACLVRFGCDCPRLREIAAIRNRTHFFTHYVRFTSYECDIYWNGLT